jgi:hypothetical protein
LIYPAVANHATELSPVIDSSQRKFKKKRMTGTHDGHPNPAKKKINRNLKVPYWPVLTPQAKTIIIVLVTPHNAAGGSRT